MACSTRGAYQLRPADRTHSRERRPRTPWNRRAWRSSRTPPSPRAAPEQTPKMAQSHTRGRTSIRSHPAPSHPRCRSSPRARKPPNSNTTCSVFRGTPWPKASTVLATLNGGNTPTGPWLQHTTKIAGHSNHSKPRSVPTSVLCKSDIHEHPISRVLPNIVH